jgi:hypothetical protein
MAFFFARNEKSCFHHHAKKEQVLKLHAISTFKHSLAKRIFFVCVFWENSVIDILKLKNLFILAASLGRRFENRQRICCAIPHVAAVRIRDADRCP